MLPRGPRGQVDAGLGKGIARGTPGLIAPTQSIVQPVETHTIDGVEIVFQLAPETEAPAEMHMFYPRARRAQHGRERLPTLHNFIPLRGARGARSAHLGQVHRRGDRARMRRRPTWCSASITGRSGAATRVLDYLERAARPLQAHPRPDAALMNKGWRPAEIAEALDLPPGLAERWSVRGYYGTVSHNVKAVYQRYLGWYDANPCNLHPLPPARGGAEVRRVHGRRGGGRSRARKADFAKGEYRWVAQVMKQVVFAEPGNIEARALCADALEQMGYQAESATWRNAYLYGAQELRHGVFQLPARVSLARRHAGRAHQRHLLRHDGDPARSGEGGRPVDGRSTGISPTATRSWRSPSAHCTLEPSPGRVVGHGGRLDHHDARHARCA